MRLDAAHRSSYATVAAAAIVCVLAGCGTNSTASPTSPPPTTAGATATSAPATLATPPAACTDVAALKSSLEALTKVRPTQDGIPALKTAIANVRTDLKAAEASASTSPELQSSVQQVKTAFADLQTAASGLNSGNLKEKAPAIASAMKQVRTATTALSSTVTESCPGS